jgi:hypothetical protein
MTKRIFTIIFVSLILLSAFVGMTGCSEDVYDGIELVVLSQNMNYDEENDWTTGTFLVSAQNLNTKGVDRFTYDICFYDAEDNLLAKDESKYTSYIEPGDTVRYDKDFYVDGNAARVAVVPVTMTFEGSNSENNAHPARDSIFEVMSDWEVGSWVWAIVAVILAVFGIIVIIAVIWGLFNGIQFNSETFWSIFGAIVPIVIAVIIFITLFE